jgi:serine/threonine protein phosphatase 1
LESKTLVAVRPRSPRLLDGTVAFAVGDIHGRLDLLDGLLGELAREAQTAARDRTRLVAVFLGDYIDRGPASAGVLDRLIELRDGGGCETVFLRGNHEQILLDLLDGAESAARWLDYGGRETLASYGVDSPPQNSEALRALIHRSLPPQHVEFLRGARLHAALGDYFFVHAGLRPDRLVEEQTDADLLWFRYYDDEIPVWEHTVVHGHSPNARPVVGRWRIGIDTEAYASGALTALRLEGDRQALLKITWPPGSDRAAIVPWDGADVSYRRERPKTPPQAAAAPAKAAADTPRPAPKPRRKAWRRPRVLFMGIAVAGVLGGLAAVLTWAWADRPAPAAAHPAPSEPRLLAEAALREAATLDKPAPDALAPASAPAAPAADVPSAAGPVAQVAAVADEAAAARLWKELSAAAPEPMTGRSMRLEAVESGGRSLHRVLVHGFADAGEAGRFCDALQAAGRACFVRPTAAAAEAPPPSGKLRLAVAVSDLRPSADSH